MLIKCYSYMQLSQIRPLASYSNIVKLVQQTRKFSKLELVAGKVDARVGRNQAFEVQ